MRVRQELLGKPWSEKGCSCMTYDAGPRGPVTSSEGALCPTLLPYIQQLLQHYRVGEAWTVRRSLHKYFTLSCSRLLGKTWGDLPSTSHPLKAHGSCSCTLIPVRISKLFWPHYRLVVGFTAVIMFSKMSDLIWSMCYSWACSYQLTMCLWCHWS